LPWGHHDRFARIFLGSTAQGRGLGPDAIRAVAQYLFTERGHHRLTIDPAAAFTMAAFS
jgi:aminoglycoside 6'-N-acetyltransferase